MGSHFSFAVSIWMNDLRKENINVSSRMYSLKIPNEGMCEIVKTCMHLFPYTNCVFAITISWRTSIKL